MSGNREFNPGWHTALDLHNLLTVSEAITRSAVERRESRGGQYREDYPAKDPEFAKFNFALKKDADGQPVNREVIWSGGDVITLEENQFYVMGNILTIKPGPDDKDA